MNGVIMLPVKVRIPGSGRACRGSSTAPAMRSPCPPKGTQSPNRGRCRHHGQGTLEHRPEESVVDGERHLVIEGSKSGRRRRHTSGVVRSLVRMAGVSTPPSPAGTPWRR